MPQNKDGQNNKIQCYKCFNKAQLYYKDALAVNPIIVVSCCEKHALRFVAGYLPIGKKRYIQYLKTQILQ